MAYLNLTSEEMDTLEGLLVNEAERHQQEMPEYAWILNAVLGKMLQISELDLELN